MVKKDVACDLGRKSVHWTAGESLQRSRRKQGREAFCKRTPDRCQEKEDQRDDQNRSTTEDIAERHPEDIGSAQEQR
jgi:hypothetical protein